jgi:hypothetical protein
MKNVAYLIAIVFGLTLASCGGSDKSTEDKEDIVQLKGYESLNLSEWGFDLNLMVPKEEINGKPKVKLTEMGTLQVVVGLDFGIEIAYGEADIPRLKTDLKEDLVFTSEIIKEEENALIYSQNIPDASVKKQCHFLYKAVVGTENYEVRDVVDYDYGAGMVEKMLEAAKTIQANTEVSK